MIIFETTLGEIQIDLFTKDAPETCKNFLQYVTEGFYDNTIFHRVIDGFMIQGGGFDISFNQKQTHAPIQNEAANKVSNARGTLAMARTSDPHSATAQFFINVKDNNFLDFTSPDVRGYGYCVFGHVVKGMDVVDQIKSVATGSYHGHDDVPVDQIVIKKAYIAK